MPGRDARHHVLIAGGGVAALEAMVALRTLAGELVDVELLSPDTDFLYRPLSVAEPFGAGEVQRFDLASLARGCGATHSLGTLVPWRPRNIASGRSRNATFSYDSLLIAIGARAREAVRGALTFRGEPDVRLVSGLLDDLERGHVTKVVFAVPGGVTWSLPLYELALLTADHLARKGVTQARLTVVTPEDASLGLFGREASDAVGAPARARDRARDRRLSRCVPGRRASPRARRGRRRGRRRLAAALPGHRHRRRSAG